MEISSLNFATKASSCFDIYYFYILHCKGICIVLFQSSFPHTLTGSRAQHECVAHAQPQGNGGVFICSTHPVLICLSAGCSERQTSPFAARLCANPVIQQSTSAERESFLTPLKKLLL